MKLLFDLQAQRQPGADHDLLVEAGPAHCALVYRHKASASLDGLRYFGFEPTEAAQELPQVLESAAETGFASITVSSAFPQALLVPNRFFRPEDDWLQPLYGVAAGTRFHDAIPEWQLTTVYSVPYFLSEAVNRLFPSATYLHAYTPTIKIYNGFIADNQLLLHFSSGEFRVLVKKAAAIQLAQTYRYDTPLDAVYFLLKICLELGLAQAEMHVVLSGLIEKDSALFAELQRYFQNLHFASPPEMQLPPGDHPQHYFTSLYNLAACAS